MLYNKFLHTIQACSLGFLAGSALPGNAFACSACFIRLFPSSIAQFNWSIPIFPTESFIAATADYGLSQNNPDLRRARFIAATADLSAPVALPHTRIKLLKLIIGPLSYIT